MGTRGDALRMLVVHPGSALQGAGRVVLEAATGFVERGMGVRAVLPGTGGLSDAFTALGVDVMLAPSVTQPDEARPRSLSSLFSGSALVRRVLDDYAPDLVYLSTGALPQWGKVARKRQIPVLLHLHELDSPAAQGRRQPYASASNADRILTVTERAREALLEEHPELVDAVEVLRSPVDGPPQLTAARARIQPPLRIGYIGRLSPDEGLDVLLRAVGDITHRGRDVHLFVSIDPSDADADAEYRAQLDEQIAARLAERVTFRAIGTSVWEALGDVDLLAMATRVDRAFNILAAEAVIGLRPVIATDLPGTRETLHGVPTATFVEPGSAAGLAEALERHIDSWAAVAHLTVGAGDELAARHDATAFRALIGVIADEVVSQGVTEAPRSRGRGRPHDEGDDTDIYDTRPRPVSSGANG